MVAFRTPLDVANKALQHCGVNQIASLSEKSRNAPQVSFAYDKEREAELQRRTWTFATRRTVIRSIDANTMRLAPALWSQIATYFVGSIVSDQAGSLWISEIRNNLNNDPLLTTFWVPYFGPRSVMLFDPTTSYSAGELVYTTAGDGTSRIYLSLQSGNSDVPGTATPWAATTTFFRNQVVTYLSVPYMSLIDLNTNNIPASSPALWNAATTYATGNQVGGADGIIYTSVGSGNIANDPTLDIGANWTNTGILTPWTTVFVGGIGSAKWLQIGGKEFPSGVGLTTLSVFSPLGIGVSQQQTFGNLFLLPAGFLRLAPQNPKVGIGALGGPTGVTYDDWLIEGEYLISRDTGPIPLRFVGDFTDVARMHTLFCQGLAALIAVAICDTVTQDKGQFAIVAKVYSEWENRASVFDGIESGPVDDPQDDLITVRY
jgi:hypothetical protein